MADVKELIKRNKHLKRQRTTWEEHWQEIADHLIPRKNQINTRRTRGDKVQTKRYASVPQHSHEILAANMQSTLTSRSFRWFDLRLPLDDPLNSDPEVRDWLQKASRTTWRTLNQSNFHSMSHEFYLDITGFGTSCMLELEKQGSGGFQGLMFKTFPIESYVFAEDADGMVNEVHIDMWMTIDQLTDRYGGAVPQKLKDKAAKNPTEMFSITHFIMPRKIRDDKKEDSKNMPFASIHIAVDAEAILEESGFREFPGFVTRWTRNSGEKYGRGPGNTALPDIKVLNKATELDLRAWAKHIDPPWFMLDDGVVGEVDLRSGKGTTVRERDALWFYEFKGRADIGRLKLEDLRQGIKQVFFADQLELPQSDRMTAEEIRTRIELMQRVLGPTLGRLETEYLNPLIDRTFNILLRRGVIPPPPEVLAERGSDLDVQYSGPLARAERLAEVSSIERLYATLANVEQVKPGTIDKIDHGKAADFIAENLDVPQEVLRTPEEFAAIQQARAQQEAQAQQSQLGLQQSEIVRNLSQADASGAGDV